MHPIYIAFIPFFAVVAANGQGSVDTRQKLDSVAVHQSGCAISMEHLIDFGRVPVGQQKSLEWDVMENSSGICTIFGNETKGLTPPFSGDGGFMVKYNGDFQQFNITFGPTVIGHFSQTMRFSVQYSDGGNTTTEDVTVIANGIAPVSRVVVDNNDLSLTPRITRATASNTTINVSFSLQASQPIRLALYDMQGNIVRQQSEERMEPGEHTMSVDRGRLPSGLYRVEIETDKGGAGQWISLVR